MNRIGTLLLLIIIATIISGLYGIIHDQITYSLSNEYYTKFKFPQFRIGDYSGKAPEVILPNPRLGVAFVGFLATWWVGLIIGAILSLVGLRHKDNKEMYRITFNAILLSVIIVFSFGIIGYVLAELFLVNLNFNFWIPDNVFDRKSFIIVGWIHNFGYLGGLIGLIVTIIYSLKQKTSGT